MPALASAILGGLVLLVGTLVGKVLVSLGMGIIIYKGLETTIDFVKDYALSSLGNLPNEILGLIAYMKVGVCINIVFSAMLVRMILNGLQSDTVKRFVMK